MKEDHDRTTKNKNDWLISWVFQSQWVKIVLLVFWGRVLFRAFLWLYNTYLKDLL